MTMGTNTHAYITFLNESATKVLKNILTDTNVTYIMMTDTKVTYNLHNRHKSTSKLIHNCHKKYEKSKTV